MGRIIPYMKWKIKKKNVPNHQPGTNCCWCPTGPDRKPYPLAWYLPNRSCLAAWGEIGMVIQAHISSDLKCVYPLSIMYAPFNHVSVYGGFVWSRSAANNFLQLRPIILLDQSCEPPFRTACPKTFLGLSVQHPLNHRLALVILQGAENLSSF